MPRVPKAIQVINERDMVTFRVLFNCNHVAHDKTPISISRAKTYEKMGLVNLCRDIDNRVILRCTAKGRSYISKLPEFAGRKPYINYAAAEHNCKLAEIYLGLSADQQRHWRTEREQADMYQDRLHELREHDYDRWKELVDKPYSPCDAAIVSESGQIELIEVVTDHYRGVEDKETYAQVMSAEVTYYKI